MRTAIEGLPRLYPAGLGCMRCGEDADYLRFREVLAIATAHDAAHAKLHDELVALRVAYGTIEAERNRLRKEYYSAHRRRQEETERRHRERALRNYYKGAMAFIAAKQDWPEDVRGYAVNILNDTPGRSEDIPARATDAMIRVVAELRQDERDTDKPPTPPYDGTAQAVARVDEAIKALREKSALPKWRQVCRDLGARQVGSGALSTAELELLNDLCELHTVRRVVESGQGEAEVPECIGKGLAARMELSFTPTRVKDCAAAFHRVHLVDDSHNEDCWPSDEVLPHIDAAGNELCEVPR